MSLSPYRTSIARIAASNTSFFVGGVRSPNSTCCFGSPAAMTVSAYACRSSVIFFLLLRYFSNVANNSLANGESSSSNIVICIKYSLTDIPCSRNSDSFFMAAAISSVMSRSNRWPASIRSLISASLGATISIAPVTFLTLLSGDSASFAIAVGSP